MPSYRPRQERAQMNNHPRFLIGNTRENIGCDRISCQQGYYIKNGYDSQPRKRHLQDGAGLLEEPVRFPTEGACVLVELPFLAGAPRVFRECPPRPPPRPAVSSVSLPAKCVNHTVVRMNHTVIRANYTVIRANHSVSCMLGRESGEERLTGFSTGGRFCGACGTWFELGRGD